LFVCEGIQFLRLIQLLSTPELLQLLHVIKTNNAIRVVKVVTVMAIVWMLGTSMYFVVSVTDLFAFRAHYHHHHHHCHRIIMFVL